MRPFPQVVGIDPSLTATGFAGWDGGTSVLRWSGRGVDRLAEAHEWARNMPLSVDLVVIEGYSFGTQRQTSHAHSLGELGGVLRLGLRHAGVEVLEVPPAVVKKYATSKGNANKDLVRDAARDRLGLPAGVTSDECDAAWLRQIGLALLGSPDAIEVPKAHREALHKLTLPEGVAA